MNFEIEYISKGKHSYVIARNLTPSQSFSMGSKAYLNQIAIEPTVISPRGLNEKGQPRVDLFVFTLIKSSDIVHFHEKMIVTLICK